MTRPTLSIVIPVYNEELNIPELIYRTVAACKKIGTPFECILVDDGSTDQSAAVLEKAVQHHPEVIFIRLNRNYGQHNATFAGYAAAKGEFIINLDADLQNPPEEIHKIYDKLLEGFDVVAGKRMNRQDTVFRRMSSCLINGMIRRSTGVVMSDYGCMLRGYTRNIVQAMLACGNQTPFIPVLANSFASRTAEVEVQHAARIAGTSRYSILKLINLQFDMLTGMTTAPLRLLSFLGLGAFALGLVLSLYILAMRLMYGPVWANEGTFTLFAILFFLVGTQFLGMGLIGEYIGRIFKTTSGHPRYFISKTYGESSIP